MKKIFHFTILICAIIAFTTNCDNQSTTEPDVQSENPFQSYIDLTDSLVENLSPERLSQRNKLISDLSNNDVYRKLVAQGIVSNEYLDILSVISQGVSNMREEIFYFDEEPLASIVSSPNSETKRDFIIKVTALGMSDNGGFPYEILKLFNDYQQVFRFYGEKGSVVSDGNTTINIPVNFDLTGFFAVVCATNTEVLDAVYEARSRGIANWSNDIDAKYVYLSSLSHYMDYLEKFYSDSKYYIKPDKEITANQLYAVYEKNEVKGDNEFRGKKLVVTGVITDFGTDMLDMPFISFEIADFKAVTCYFNQNKSKLVGELSKGDHISVLGTCHGNTLGNIIIDECIIWE